MKKRLISFKLIASTLLVSLASLVAVAGLPNTDLKIQLRQAAERDITGYVVGTQASAASLVVQSVSVKNGEKASLLLSVSMPMQWLQEVDAQSASATVSGITTQGSGAGIANALTWLEEGQSVTVTPRWPGGKHPVSMEIGIQTAMVDERTGAELPNQTRSQLTTTLNAVMGEWVTIAKSGQRATAGSYSSSAATDAPQLIQIRVTVNSHPPVAKLRSTCSAALQIQKNGVADRLLVVHDQLRVLAEFLWTTVYGRFLSPGLT